MRRFSIAWLLAGLAPLVPAQDVPSPEAVLGHQVGADHFLANYTQLTEYWTAVAAASDRVVLEDIGTTSYGQTMRMAIISSPANLAKREHYRRISEQMGRARVDREEAERLAAEGRAVIWIDAGMHATESVAAQNILELVYRMASRSDAETLRILDQVILLVCPANPDGMELIANGYMATRTVGRIPVLYQRYIGHDNNRDFYMATMPETEAINRVLYRRWFPQVIYNHHQTAPRGTILFTPPFRDPFNYNCDPLVVRGIELVAAHMNARFTWEGKPGVISRSGATYSTWWNGGLRTTAYFHNAIGILTEAYGSPNPGRLEPSMRRALPFSDYPLPIGEREWHARDTIEYLQTANLAILDLASRYREQMLMNLYIMGRNSIERGSRDFWTPTPRMLAEAERRSQAEAELGEDGGAEPEIEVFADPALRDPRAYVLPSDQPDFSAATRFVHSMWKCGVEVHRADQPFEAHGVRYPAGSFVIHAAQAYRPHVMDMFEPQWHPDDIGANGEPIRPYDSAGWTPALSMDVRFDRILDAFDAPLTPLTDAPTRLAGRVTSGVAGYLLARSDTHSATAINRLLAAGESVATTHAKRTHGGTTYPAGTAFVRRGDATEARVAALAKELGVSFVGVDAAPDASAMRPARVGLFDVYGGNMATGWTEWMLRQRSFDVGLVFGRRINEGELRRDFDVLVFHAGLPFPAGEGDRVQRALRRGRPSGVSADDLAKMVAALPAFEDWSTATDRQVAIDASEAIPALREFVEDGGTLIALGSQADAVIRHFDLPVRVGTFTTDEDGEERRTNRTEFYIPTSLLRGRVDTDVELGHGVSPRLSLVYRRSPVFQVDEGAEDVRVVARYADEDILASGWAVGEEFLADKGAVLEVRMGAGRICLFGADVVFRGQAMGSAKMLSNAILSW